MQKAKTFLALPDASWLLRMASVLLLLAFASTAPAQPVSYSISTLGTSTAYAGHTVYFMLTPTIASSAALPVIFNSVTVASTPVQFGVNCRIDECGKNSAGLYQIWIYPDAESAVILRATIPQTMTPGQHSLEINTDVKGSLKTTSIPLRVLPPATPLPTQASIPAPPIPNLAKWQSSMIKYGKKWCDPTENYGSFAIDTTVWYYDGARVFYQIADYTGDTSFNACALNIARQYRDYVIRQDGQIPAWRVFTKGLRMAYERTGDPSYRTAIKLLATYGFVRWQNAVSENAIRETAYALESVIQAEKAGEPRSPHMYRLANYLIGHYDRIFVQKKYVIHQTFFDGLAAEALIEYYQVTQDPRVPAVIRTMLDWMWDSGWDKARYKLVNNPDPVGPTCANGCQVYYTGLINLVAPAFAWYWSVTGDSLYLQRGDEFFAHSLDEDISYSGKIFSQNYRWSFDYLRWRPSNACEFNVSWPATAVPAAGGTASVTVLTGSSCKWTAQIAESWATAGGETRTGGGIVTINVVPNTAAGRTAALTVAGKAGSLNQTAASSSTNAIAMNAAPAAGVDVGSMSPLTGSGPSNSYTATFTHGGGSNELYLGYILFLPTPNVVQYTAKGSCLVEYNRISHGMRLINDAGTGWLGPLEGVRISPTAGVLKNSQCTLNISAASASVSGNTMSVTAPVTFHNSASPRVATFLQAVDVHDNWTGMTQFGNWEYSAGAPRPGPSVVAVNVSASQGSSVVYTFTTAHTSGVGSITMMNLLINDRILGSSPCHALYFPGSNTLNLLNDDSSGLVSAAGLSPGTPGTIANARCAINVGRAERFVSGNNLTIVFHMSFQPGSFGGQKKVYTNVFDNVGQLSHWVQIGTLNVQ